MLIIPSLYLQNGHAVSLYKGNDNDQKIVHSRTPFEIAREFAGNNASLIQVIDLDAHLESKTKNRTIIEKMVRELPIPIEVGGAIRSMETVARWFECGVARQILGVSARHLIPEALAKYGPERILFGIKARQSRVDSDSLPPDSDEVIEIAEQVVAQGITTIIYKDMEVQGALYHPNYDDVDRLILMLGPEVQVISAGGVTSLRDLQILKQIKTAGVVISRALIEHKLSLSQAVREYETDQDRARVLVLVGTR